MRADFKCWSNGVFNVWILNVGTILNRTGVWGGGVDLIKVVHKAQIIEIAGFWRGARQIQVMK